MSLHRHREVALVEADLGDVWRFFSDPRNLSKITPPWLGLQLTCEPPAEMYPGLILTYTVRPIARVPMTWVTEITHVLDRRLFVDEQRFGPYRFWHHQHHFRQVPAGVEMEDIVHYAVPFGPLGDAVNRLSVKQRVQSIFSHRTGVIREVFPARGPEGRNGYHPGAAVPVAGLQTSAT
ncbi:MAG: SRPBCC family protein [Dehalococcoidia bacterium]